MKARAWSTKEVVLEKSNESVQTELQELNEPVSQNTG